jgi:hypothetical protein
MSPYFYFSGRGRGKGLARSARRNPRGDRCQEKPRYTTVLDLDTLIEKTHTREDIDKVIVSIEARSTSKKRRVEMARMYDYTQDNLVSPEVDTGDLDGVSASAGAVISSDTDDHDDGLLGGLTMRETGVYRWTEEGVAKL